MFHSTTNVYATKRETVNFAKDLSSESGQVESKFVLQSIYGILKSGSVVLRNIAVALNESIQVKNTTDRLSKHLQQPLSRSITDCFTEKMVNALKKEPVILVDDSDVVKPHGRAFEALGQVRDGSSKDK